MSSDIYKTFKNTIDPSPENVVSAFMEADIQVARCVEAGGLTREDEHDLLLCLNDMRQFAFDSEFSEALDAVYEDANPVSFDAAENTREKYVAVNFSYYTDENLVKDFGGVDALASLTYNGKESFIAVSYILADGVGIVPFCDIERCTEEVTDKDLSARESLRKKLVIASLTSGFFISAMDNGRNGYDISVFGAENGVFKEITSEIRSSVRGELASVHYSAIIDTLVSLLGEDVITDADPLASSDFVVSGVLESR